MRLGDLAFRLDTSEYLLVLPRSSEDAVGAIVTRLGKVLPAADVVIEGTYCATGELLVSAIRRVRNGSAPGDPTGLEGLVH